MVIYSKPRVILLTTKEELKQYQYLYHRLSGLNVDQSFLSRSKVFGLIDANGDLQGGYCIHDTAAESRTLKYFIREEYRAVYKQKYRTDQESVELCCFWLNPRMPAYRKASFWIWIYLAIHLYRAKGRYVLFGTNSRSLAKVYSYPSKSRLICVDQVNGAKTWTFFSQKSYILRGVLSILQARFNHTQNTMQLWQPLYLQMFR